MKGNLVLGVRKLNPCTLCSPECKSVYVLSWIGFKWSTLSALQNQVLEEKTHQYKKCR